ncbi:MAG: rubrerythrin family protein [Eubacteriales bacterium]
MNVMNTNTIENIRKSFSGECEAIVRYHIFADIAKTEGRLEDANLFLGMAKNEMEHAKIWYKYLQEQIGDTAANLLESAGNENDEWKEMYPQFAREAKKEGFEEIATLFERIASIECSHERKFLERSMETTQEEGKEEKVVPNKKENYYCIFCGFASKESLSICPVCNAEQAFE